MTREDIAKVCHEVNRAYCSSIGDNTQVSWEDAPAWQRYSACLGVDAHLDNPKMGASGSHESWLKQKLEEGWEYGPIKDPEKKQHPCIMPFNELPVSQQAKDFIFSEIVHQLSGFLEE